MNDILLIVSYLFYITIFSTVLFSINYYYKIRKFNSAKHEINVLQAKIVNYRIALKSRIKTKVTSFRKRFVNPTNNGDPIDNAINELSENKFETAKDFQDYIDISKKINAMIASTSEGSSQDGKSFEDFMGPDFKNEIAIIRILKEITDTNDKLIAKIASYNKAAAGKVPKITEAPSLRFPALIDVNRVFASSDKMSNSSKASSEEAQKAS